MGTMSNSSGGHVPAWCLLVQGCSVLSDVLPGGHEAQRAWDGTKS